MSVIKKISLFIVSFFVLVGFTVPPRPSHGVYDPHGYLKQSVIEKVDGVNKQLATTDKKPQVAVVVVDRLNGTTIEQAALQTAREWKIGFSDTNMGALIFVSVKDRKMRIETSDEMATIVTDYQANQIIDAAKSDFRQEDYSAGVSKMVDGLLVTIGKKLNISIDENIVKRVENFMGDTTFNFSNVMESVVLLFVTLFILVSIFGKSKRKRGSGLEDVVFLSFLDNMTRSARRSRRYHDDDDDFFGGFGGGSSGGSSGGWSGGGFSGGGSSGGW